ncbi:hypothetical protein Tco_0568657 [Tanacetum coccineum]
MVPATTPLLRSPSLYNGIIAAQGLRKIQDQAVFSSTRSRNAEIPNGRRNNDYPQHYHNTSGIQDGDRSTRPRPT